MNVVSVLDMKATLAGMLASCALGLLGCSDDHPGSGGATAGAGGASSDTGGGSGGDATSESDRCHDGCALTLAANCENGPADQASCESTCHSLEVGKCGAEYATFQSCAEGQAVSCSAQGLPLVEACPDEQTAFVACINQ